ncbi:MAG: HD domain-containing protein [Lachnospiraceae bacterium]|nr:HD domain-containing protein [Lachnospiraceae bacterium]
MRYVPIVKVKPGMELGKNIYDGEGRILWERKLCLKKDDVQKLFYMEFPGIYVEDEFSGGLKIPQMISTDLRREALRLVHDLFRDDMLAEIQQDDIQEVARKIVKEVLAHSEYTYNMIDTKVQDDYTYFHSVNVAVLSTMLGAACNLDLEGLNVLAAAALLHDIGKRYVEPDVLNAKRVLTEEERILVVQHPKLSYDFLVEHYDFLPEVCEGVLEHHEWYNGCGYPMRKSGSDISDYARMIKIADVFDALTSKLPYHDPISPSGAIDYIMANTGAEFDSDFVDIFTQKIAIYPVGCVVALSDGSRALVVENDSEFMLRPKVKMESDGRIVDLRAEEAQDLAVLDLLI